MSKHLNKRGLLLASFLETDDEGIIMKEVEEIVNNLSLTNKYIFLLQLREEPHKKILTYNAITEKNQPFNPRLYTIRIHRKKQTNTLYTINALNAAIASQHEGKTGKHLKLDWDEYKDSLILSTHKKLNVHPIEVVKIFKIEDPPEEN
tara:strand:- start:82 stop:525 length:444 start_codon:yes stop_codon:yes gene_type:complete